MSDTIADLIPARVREVELYDPHRGAIEHDLSDNTSQWGMAPAVRELIANITTGDVKLSRYPDIYASGLKDVIAQKYGEVLIDGTANITVGNGTDDVLDAIIRALTNENDLVLQPMPSFPMPGYFARMNGRRIVGSTLQVDGSLDIDDILHHNPVLVYVCTPNNPTGTKIPRDNIEELIERYSGFIIIDEAYADFSDSNVLDLLMASRRVIITRTMSKLHALAGLRIGYALADKEVISSIEAVRGPYKANTIGLEASKVSLGETDFHNKVIDDVRNVRNWWSMELSQLGYVVIPSETNFVYVQQLDAEKLQTPMTTAGYAIRWFDVLPVIGRGARITLAPKEILEPLLDVIKGAS